MRRWHAERDLMLRRWRFEIALHEDGWRLGQLHPLPPVICDDSCHCYLGPGFFRDRHPLDCGKSRCGICHNAKRFDRARRQREEREAWKNEWEAAEGW